MTRGVRTMVDPTVTGLIGYLLGIVTGPLLFAGMTALYQMTEALDQDVDDTEET